jgi:hypothetical protein
LKRKIPSLWLSKWPQALNCGEPLKYDSRNVECGIVRFFAGVPEPYLSPQNDQLVHTRPAPSFYAGSLTDPVKCSEIISERSLKPGALSNSTISSSSYHFKTRPALTMAPAVHSKHTSRSTQPASGPSTHNKVTPTNVRTRYNPHRSRPLYSHHSHLPPAQRLLAETRSLPQLQKLRPSRRHLHHLQKPMLLLR